MLISKTIEGKSIFMEGRAPRAEVLRDRSQTQDDSESVTVLLGRDRLGSPKQCD